MLKAAGLEYETRGDGEPVLFIHGGAICDGDLPLMSQKALKAYKLVRYRRRGYGGSARHSGRASFKAQAVDGLNLLNALEITRAHIVGHSYGGLIAIQMALDSPLAVHSIVLSEPALSFLLPAGWPTPGAPFAAMQERVAAEDYVGAVNLILIFALGPDWRTEVERMLPGAPGKVDRDAPSTVPFEVSLGEFDINQTSARRIRQPVLSLRGTASAPRALDVRQLLHSWFPQTEDFDVVGGNHLLQYHSPEAARQAAEGIAAFVRRHPMSSP